jgi:hypothetical protein
VKNWTTKDNASLLFQVRRITAEHVIASVEKDMPTTSQELMDWSVQAFMPSTAPAHASAGS